MLAANLHAENVAVLCPHCGALQLAEYGGELWKKAEVAERAGKLTCGKCGEGFVLVDLGQVKF